MRAKEVSETRLVLAAGRSLDGPFTSRRTTSSKFPAEPTIHRQICTRTSNVYIPLSTWEDDEYSRAVF